MSFPITCTACNKTFTISDEIYEKKVAGRVVTIKCKSCSQGIRVDGTKKPGEAPAEAAPTPAPAEPSAPTEPLWAVDYPDGQDREFTTSEVVAELERGVIGGATLVWRDGMAEWLELSQVPELASELSRLEAAKAEAAKAEAAKAEAAKAEAAKAEAAKAEAARAEAAKAEAAKAEAQKKVAATLAGVKSVTSTPIHTPRPPMPTETGLGGLPGAEKSKPGAARKPFEAPKAAAPPVATEPAAPRAKLPSGPDLTKPRAKLPSAPDLSKSRAKLPSAPELVRPRGNLPSAPELVRPRGNLPSAPELVRPAATATPLPVVAPPPRLDAATATPLPSPQAFAAKAAFPPPTPAAASAPAPIAAVSAPVAPAPPAATATPPLPESVAKIVSNPPQTVPAFPGTSSVAPAFGGVPALVSDHATVEWPEAKRKTPLIILGLVAVALVAGVVIAFSGREKLPPPTPIAPAPVTAAPTTPPVPSPAATATSQPGSETASGSDPVLTRDPGATPGAGFAELFAAGARKAESNGATVAPTARFDPAATKVPLAQAANEAQACKQSGGPTGKVTVVVTFDPSGKVSSATITDAPFAGTPTAVCISSALKRASIAPFSGLPGTVSKTFSIL